MLASSIGRRRPRISARFYPVSPGTGSTSCCGTTGLPPCGLILTIGRGGEPSCSSAGSSASGTRMMAVPAVSGPRDALRAGTPHAAWIDVQSEPLGAGMAIEHKLILHDECRDCSVELAARCWLRSESGKYPDADLFQARNLLPLLDELGLELTYGWPTDFGSLVKFDDPEFHRFQYVELEVRRK